MQDVGSELDGGSVAAMSESNRNCKVQKPWGSSLKIMFCATGAMYVAANVHWCCLIKEMRGKGKGARGQIWAEYGGLNRSCGRGG